MTLSATGPISPSDCEPPQSSTGPVPPTPISLSRYHECRYGLHQRFKRRLGVRTDARYVPSHPMKHGHDYCLAAMYSLPPYLPSRAHLKEMREWLTFTRVWRHSHRTACEHSTVCDAIVLHLSFSKPYKIVVGHSNSNSSRGKCQSYLQHHRASFNCHINNYMSSICVVVLPCTDKCTTCVGFL